MSRKKTIVLFPVIILLAYAALRSELPFLAVIM